ncbi:MAG: cupin domain-containing protein [Verrucomicrobia bacterium]|nr:cupin domain-containing protein [Verrucomicrobiota bacterium]
MIVKNYKDGMLLKVADLNKITVIFDRGESENTEVGLNEWPPHLDGPPHFHDEKEQVFYVTSGVGIVKLGDEQHDVKEGCLVYIPAGLKHQTITTSDEPLCYLLFNLYESNENKTFEQHIETVRSVRREQAETQSTGSESTIAEIKNAAKFFTEISEGQLYEFGPNQTILLIDRTESERIELVVVIWPAGNKGAMVVHSEKEQTFFVLEGKGEVTIGDDTQAISPGDVVFVPRNTPHTTESFDEELKYLCLNTLIGDLKDASFEEMYNRISPERRKRWLSGSTDIGE